MRLDIEKIQNQRIAVIEADKSEEIRYRTLFLRQLYAVERVLPFERPEIECVTFAPGVTFLVIRLCDVRNNSDA